MIAEQTFRRLDAPEFLAEVAEGVTYVNGVRMKRVWFSSWSACRADGPAEGEFDRGSPSITERESSQLHDVLAGLVLPSRATALEADLEEAFEGRLNVGVLPASLCDSWR